MADEANSNEESEPPKSTAEKNTAGIITPPEKAADAPLEPAAESKTDAEEKKQKTIDFLDRIVRKAKKKAKEDPDDPSIFLKMFGGILKHIESKANESAAEKNVNQILAELLHQLNDGKTLKDALTEIKNDRNFMSLEGAEKIVGTLGKNPQKTQALVDHIKAEIEALKTPEAEKSTAETMLEKGDVTLDETAVELSEIKPTPQDTGKSVNAQRSNDSITKLTSKVTRKMAGNSFSTKGPASITSESSNEQPDIAPTATTPSSNGPGITPQK